MVVKEGQRKVQQVEEGFQNHGCRVDRGEIE